MPVFETLLPVCAVDSCVPVITGDTVLYRVGLLLNTEILFLFSCLLKG